MKVSEIAERIGGRVIGDGNHEVDRVANLATAKANEISFLSDEKMHKYLSETKAGAVIVQENAVTPDAHINFIVVKSPYIAFARVAQIFDTTPRSATGIHPSAVIDSTAIIEQNVSIGANAVIEADARICEGAQIGANCFIGSQSVLANGITVGDDIVVGAGSLVRKSINIKGIYSGNPAILKIRAK